MSKALKNSLITIIIAVVILVLTCIIYQNYKTSPISANNIETGNITPNLEDDFTNELELKNNITNKAETKNEKINNNISNTVLDELENQMTPNEEKAIKLAKNEWLKENENTNGVQFNVSVQSDGKYLITVYDIKTTKLIKGYVVDVQTEIVNEK